MHGRLQVLGPLRSSMLAATGADLRVSPVRDTRMLLDLLVSAASGGGGGGGSQPAASLADIPAMVTAVKEQLHGCAQSVWAERPGIVNGLGRKVWDWHTTSVYESTGRDRCARVCSSEARHGGPCGGQLLWGACGVQLQTCDARHVAPPPWRCRTNAAAPQPSRKPNPAQGGPMMAP